MINAKRFVWLVIVFAWVGAAYAVSPLEHENKSPDQIVKRAVAEDEEDVYFILSGEADKAIADEDYPTAILRLREAINYDPGNPSNPLLLSNLGLLYGQMGQDSLALSAYDEALRRAPSMTHVREQRGKQLLKLGHEKEALVDFALVLQRDSLRTVSLYYHGMISLYGGDLLSAQRDFARLESIEPESYDTNLAMSTLYSLTGENRKAIPYYEKLIDAEPAVEYYAALAECYLSLGELSSASHTIAEGMKECGEDAELYYCRAWLNRDSFLLDAARADAKRAIQLGADAAKVNQLFNNPKKK